MTWETDPHAVRDNRAISQASAQAQRDGVPLIVLHVFSPQDYIAHDRGARRIDFTLRNLAVLRVSIGFHELALPDLDSHGLEAELAKLNIPLYTVSHSPRTKIPAYIVELLGQWKASHLFANIEYEVDELRRDIAVSELANKQGNLACEFVHDKCIIAPGDVRTKEGRGYTVSRLLSGGGQLPLTRQQVYSPFLRAWKPILDRATSNHLAEAKTPAANDATIHSHSVFGKLFKVEVPEHIEGFSLSPEERKRISTVWHAGEDAAHEVWLCSGWN